MFARLFRPLWNKVSPRTLLTATAILSYSLYRNRILLDSPIEEPTLSQDQIKNKQLAQYVKQLQTLDICEGKDILQNQRKIVTVKDVNGVQRKIMITRMQGKLYAFLAACPHQQPFQPSDTNRSLEKAVLFTDKLYCPHHGCIFDIKSGSIQYGPAVNNLPIFFAQQTNGMVQLLYPLAIPTSVAPNATEKDVEDLRKAVILGDDDAAAIGCINSLRQFGYQGQITVAREGTYEYPYRKEYLHKKLLNLHLQQPETLKNVEENHNKKVQKQKNQKKSNKSKLKKITLKQKLNMYIQDQLQQKIYTKLQYFDQNWYKNFGVDFVFNDEPYRIINKQYYPYITFADGTKLQYDAMMIATSVVPKIPIYEGITTEEQKDTKINLPENVFSPLRSKEQHLKLNKFLNNNTIKSLLVLGYNMQSLQFINALKYQFPQIKVTVIDNQPNSSISQFVGPDLQKAIAKQFTSRGVQFFIKVRDQLFFSNKFSKNNIQKRKEEEQLKKIEAKPIQNSRSKNKNKNKSNNKNDSIVNTEKTLDDPKLKYNDSVTARISDNLRIKADGVVLFPNSYEGNLEWVKNGKYTDFDYYHSNRLGGDSFGRTQSIRIFSAGLSSANEYFLMKKRLVTFDPTTAYEQGFNVGLNMQALRIPFTYVPYQKYQFFDKKFFYIGTRDFFDSVLLMGSLQNWDFLAIYGIGNEVKGVSGSPSRSRQLSIIREAMRVNCMPSFQDLVSGYWTVQNLRKLIKKLNKSGCYRDIIFQNRQNIHMKDLLWMQRTADAGFENDRPQNTQDHPSQEVGTDGKLKDL